MIKILLTAYCLLLTAFAAYAVNGVATDPSRNLFSARQLGMGGATIGFSSDANGIFSNPAGLAGAEFPQLTASSRKIMLDETQYSLTGWAVPTNFGTFGIGYVGMEVGGSIPTQRDPATGRIIQSASLESSNYLNNVTAVSYSKELPLPIKTWLGINYKIFNQSLSGGGISDKGTASNLDLALMLKPFGWLTVGGAYQNMQGGSIKWGSTEDKLNSTFKIGGAIDFPFVNIGFDLESPNNLYHAGLEFLPIKTIAIRTGLNQEAAGSGMTYGVGLVNGGFRFDYAYVERPGLPGDNPHYFSLSYIGERVLTVDRKLKTKVVQAKLLQPHDRLITDQEYIDITGEASVTKILDQKRTWTVTTLSSTFDAFEVTESENAAQIYLNGKLIEKIGTIEAREVLRFGRNTFQIVSYSSTETISKDKILPAVIGSAEVKVLRITPFTDAPMGFWAIEPISLNVTLGLVTGYPDNTFKPDKGITRAELISLLVRSLNIPQDLLEPYATAEVFNDISAKHWASKYVIYGTALKLVTGYPDDTYKPNKVLNRAEGITILARYAGLSEEAAVTSPFPDLKPDFWANKFIAPAKNAGLLKYLEGKEFNPGAEFTRAEACEVLYRVPTIQRKVNEFWETGVISAGR